MFKVAEALSLFLTIPGLYLALILLWHWIGKTLEAIGTPDDEKTGGMWITIGVSISFIGGFFDNLYWYAAWAASFVGWEFKDYLFKHGVYSNIPFRQMALIIAAWCHLKAVDVYLERDSKQLNKHLVTSMIIGVVITLFLFYISGSN